MTWLITAWGWFSGTKVGRWLIGAALALAALGALALTIYEKGKHAQATTDEAKDAKVQADAVKVAQETYTEASDAAAKVEQDAKAAPPPDTAGRADFDNTGFDK